MSKTFRCLKMICLQMFLFCLMIPPTVANASVMVNPNGNGIIIDINGGTGTSSYTDVASAFNGVYATLRTFVVGATGICSIALVGVFAFKAFQLASTNNPKERADAIKSLIYTALGAALLGGSSILTGLAYGLFV